MVVVQLLELGWARTFASTETCATGVGIGELFLNGFKLYSQRLMLATMLVMLWSNVDMEMCLTEVDPQLLGSLRCIYTSRIPAVYPQYRGCSEKNHRTYYKSIDDMME